MSHNGNGRASWLTLCLSLAPWPVAAYRAALRLDLSTRRVSTTRMAAGSDPLLGMNTPAETQVQNLLLRCALQAQISYYNEFKNECKARWLESFLGHEILRVQVSSCGLVGGTIGSLARASVVMVGARTCHSRA